MNSQLKKGSRNILVLSMSFILEIMFQYKPNMHWFNINRSISRYFKNVNF